MNIRYIVILIFGVFNGFVQAQEFGSTQKPVQTEISDRPAQYILGSGDVLLITINLWGHVLKPGIYSVPSSFGIIDLLSSAGGPLQSARLNDVRIIRKNQEVITVNIDEFIKTGNQDLLVPLQPGDVIIVSGSIGDVFKGIVAFMRDIAIILNVVILAIAIN
jgi:protein involved in polysaccharide export with SLBB domain